MVLNIQAAASRRLTDLHLLWFQSHRRWTIFPLLLSQIYLHLIHSLVHHKKRRNLPPLFFLLWFWLLFFFLGYIIIAASASSASSEAIGPTRCPGCPLDYGHSLTPHRFLGTTLWTAPRRRRRHRRQYLRPMQIRSIGMKRPSRASRSVRKYRINLSAIFPTASCWLQQQQPNTWQFQ